MDDQHYLERALEIASFPGAAVEPNPKVGAVIVHDGRIIGEGWHRRFGEAHAEVNAVNSVEDQSLLSGSTLYVTLEPCSHHGKTPPCADLIIRHGIPKVVIGMEDPFPAVKGSGIQRLRDAGVAVSLAPDPEPFRALIRHFLFNQHAQRPYLTLKWAESADGFIAAIAAGEARRTAISGPFLRRFVHGLRHEHQAILVGTQTALTDDPALDNRFFPGYSPVKIVIDENHQLPLSMRFFHSPGKALVVTASPKYGHDVMAAFHSGMADLPELFSKLYREYEIGSILIEGGAAILQSCLDQGLFDEVIRVRSSHRLGEGVPAPKVPEGVDLQPEFQVDGEISSRWLRPL